jgi:uncharacterized protein (DUF1501 family)
MKLRLTRRAALLGLGGAVACGPAALAMAPAATRRRFVVVLLRGALDGLSAVVPYGDPDLVRWRADLVPPGPGQEGGVLDLGGFWGLHPALAGMHAMYAAGEALPVHAVAGEWRSRSHFEAQDYLELGTTQAMSSGWLNRVASALPAPAAGTAVGQLAMAVGTEPPPLLRGPAPVGSWLPHRFGNPDGALYTELAALHRADPVTGPAIAAGLRERGFTAEALAGVEPAANRFALPALAAAAGRLLAAEDGPRLAAMELIGWDTHVAQVGRLPGPLRQLDAGLVALKEGLGPAWAETVVLVVTEFGRTVRANGTRGTDHGTGTVAFVVGGVVQGGRVLADWPGLKPGGLFEDRDLQPTLDLRALAKGLLAQHLGLAAAALGRVFPDSADAPPRGGLLRA